MAGRQQIDVADGKLTIVEDGKVAKFVPEVEHVTFSGRLLPEGLTVTEVAPGVDLERDVLARVPIPLHVATELRLMDDRVFRPEPMGLRLGDTFGQPDAEVKSNRRERIHAGV
jgi:acyl CoA:acetate/3-ketoacid CoA transferase